MRGLGQEGGVSSTEMEGQGPGPEGGHWALKWSPDISQQESGDLSPEPPGPESCKPPKGAWRQIYPQSLKLRSWPLDFSLVGPQTESLKEPTYTCDLQNYEMIPGCCFKLLNL